MKTFVLLIFFINLIISEAHCDHEHERHKNIHASTHSNRNEHGRRIRRQWSSGNYRSYSPHYNRDFYINGEEQLLTEILSFLRQIKLNLSTQKQQTVQPIYNPYPYPVSLRPTQKPDFVPRKSIPALPSRNNFDAADEYSRPISLKPITKAPLIQPQSTEKNSDAESAIIFPTTPAMLDADNPSSCETAIITCCRFPEPKDKKECFAQYKCNKTYATNLACKKEIIQTVVQKFVDTYAPK